MKPIYYYTPTDQEVQELISKGWKRMSQNTYYKRLHNAGKQPTIEEIKRLPYSCRVCKSVKKLELDHIKGLAEGGKNEINNRQWLCHKCHIHKKKKFRK